MKLLLVEDDHDLSNSLTTLLSESGYVVEQAFNGKEASQLLTVQSYDAILLDLLLPDMQGHVLLNALRNKNNSIPVLIISAQNKLNTVIDHLNLGADDYLTKPFSFQELDARLRTVMRRSSGHPNPILSFGSLQYDTNSKRFSNLGKSLSLTPREHALLVALIKVPGKTKSKKELGDELCCLDDSLSPKAVEIYIARLRKKIETDNSSVQIITLRSLGYMLSHVAE